MSAKFQDNFLRAVVSFENRKIQLGVVSVYNQLTQKDIDAMKAEIEHRKVVVRKELLEDVKEARAHGDLKILNTMLRRKKKTGTKAEYGIWKE